MKINVGKPNWFGSCKNVGIAALVSFFCFSGTEEWTTNITVSVMDANGDAISSKNISNAPFVRNRSTDYSGMMFASSSGMMLTLNADWATPVTATF